jgi:hypothetical protein
MPEPRLTRYDVTFTVSLDLFHQPRCRPTMAHMG